MKTKTTQVLSKVLNDIKPPKEDLKFINENLQKFLVKIKQKIVNLGISVEVFVGGSFAKGTVIKKDYYDVDVFIRFGEEHRNEDLSKLAKKLLGSMKNVSMIHGSRDYFRIKIKRDFFIEMIPVLKVRSPREAENITDLSYSHVRYLNRKVKSSKILDDIRLAKAFCYANNCYGAESYIRGFSGYGLELLVYHYGGFMKFIRAMIKINTQKSTSEKEVIDIEKHHKNKRAILMDLNSSKLHSPIVLVDPTYKQRNVLAALSQETFEKFQEVCMKFLKSPSTKAFERQKTDLKRIKEDAEKNKHEFILLEAKTNKQEGDIAGSKLLKFYRHIAREISEYFDIKDKGFNYNNKQSARYFFVAKSKEKILREGPFAEDKNNVKRFQKEHKNTFIKKGKVYAIQKIDFTLSKFMNDWKRKNKRKIKEMSIKGLDVLK